MSDAAWIPIRFTKPKANGKLLVYLASGQTLDAFYYCRDDFFAVADEGQKPLPDPPEKIVRSVTLYLSHGEAVAIKEATIEISQEVTGTDAGMTSGEAIIHLINERKDLKSKISGQAGLAKAACELVNACPSRIKLPELEKALDALKDSAPKGV